MWDLSRLTELGGGKFVLLFGAGLLYACSQLAAHILDPAEQHPGRRAIGYFLPIAATALAAVQIQRSDLALSVIFSTAIAAMSLVLGSIVLSAPQGDAPASARRLWPFLPLVAFLVLLAGFSGRLSTFHAGIFALQGLLLLSVWWRPTKIDPPIDAAPPGSPRYGRAITVLLVCLVLAMLGGKMAMLGTVRYGDSMAALPTRISMVAVLAPILAAPMLVSGSALAHRKRSWVAMTAGVGVVQLNLCLLLPMVILATKISTGFAVIGNEHAYMEAIQAAPPFIFPMALWRVDNIMLLILGFVLVAVSLGRWRLMQSEGLVLICMYGLYVLTEALASQRL